MDQPKYLQLVLPTEYADDPVISWNPANFLNDPDIADPIFTPPAAGLYPYTVSVGSFSPKKTLSPAVYI